MLSTYWGIFLYTDRFDLGLKFMFTTAFRNCEIVFLYPETVVLLGWLINWLAGINNIYQLSLSAVMFFLQSGIEDD